MFSNRMWVKAFVLALLLVLVAESAHAVRIKDLTNVRGVRGNQLIGFGLIIGLAGTGDSATNVFFSIQTLVSMLSKMGITVPSNEVDQLKFKNVATVMVTATLPAFARQGDQIDTLLSSVGDAKSLQGGTLLMTALKGPDGKTYAVAQGPLSIGGFFVQGAAKGAQKNHQTVARMANGAYVERELPHRFNFQTEVFLTLKETDFTTASRISRAVNDAMRDIVATLVDGRTVKIKVPAFYKNKTSQFITRIESIDVEPDGVAKVILDERTGTVVMGEKVMISAVAVAHGNLFIQITEEPSVSQAAPLSLRGETVVVPRTRLSIKEGEDKLLIVPKSISLGQVVNGLNAIGVNPRDLIAILQAIKASGALHAELEIM
ncbi:Flagellar P-ring protein FlgI [hydrothermal vent metagenome]|uniref:Flagellar P-ring protein FlgI n=1 Tax=hydrothermal vent metagenome TaxID=652676 RepID=A0A3B1DB65_9ZZZZ